MKVMRIATGEEQEDITPMSAAATLEKARATKPNRPAAYKKVEYAEISD